MRNSASTLRKGIVAAALLIGAAQFAASAPARAQSWQPGGNGGADHPDWGADHNEIYQVQRGDMVCQSREACGGPAAIAMNRPGWFYLPGGIYAAQRPALVEPVAPVVRHHKKKYRY
jgi:hypothetical protein